jgi:hypothetical protein
MTARHRAEGAESRQAGGAPPDDGPAPGTGLVDLAEARRAASRAASRQQVKKTDDKVYEDYPVSIGGGNEGAQNPLMGSISSNNNKKTSSIVNAPSNPSLKQASASFNQTS